MKIFIWFILFLSSYEQSISGVRIFGKVKGAPINRVTVFLPVNGFSNETVDAFSQMVKIMPDSSFLLEFSVDTSVFVKVLFDNHPFWVIVAPNDQIEIEIDFSKNFPTDTSAVQIRGKNSKGILFINKLNFYPIQKFSFIYTLLKQQNDPEILLKKFTDSCNKILNRLSELLNQDEISSDFYLVAECSFKGILFAELIKKISQSKFYSQAFSPDELLQFFDIFFNFKDGIYNPGFRRAYLNPIIYSQYFSLKAFAAYKLNLNDRIPDSLFFWNNQENKVTSDFSNFLFIKNDEISENCFGYLLYNILKIAPFALKKEDMEYFKSKFPGSIYLSSLESFQSNTKSNLILSNDVNIVDSTNLRFKKVSDIISFYNFSQPVIIDLWASWCIPCRIEFKANSVIDSILQKYKIKKLYISYDYLEMKKAWINTISFYNLKGDHILAGNELQQDMERIFFNNDAVSLPRYILINNKGKIKDVNLPRPTETGKFIEIVKKSAYE